MSVGTANNATAFSVYTNYVSSSIHLSKSMNRLATGVKNVVDDGAGVGISERMRSQARSTAMARNNVDNAISVMQTADGWMQRISNMLGRMHELAVESNDATKTDSDRANIEAEFGALKSEVERIVDTAAKFNGKNLLNGSISGATQVGADQGQTITLTITNLSAVIDGIGNVSTATNAATAITTVQAQINVVSTARASVGGLQSRLENTRAGLLTYEDNIRSAESKIRDVDAARESSELMKYQILSQVGNAMLAQANQLPGSILQLLR